MSVLNFPATPTVGDIWNQNNNRWRFDGQVWVSYNEAINVKFTTPTGSAILPKGTTTQRDDPAESGYIRYNTQTNQFEGYGTSWGTIGAPSIVNDTTTNATYYPAFTTTTTGSTSSVRVSSTKLNFNPSSGVLTATAFSGGGSGLTNVNAAQVANTLTRGTYLTGNNFNGSAATTWAVDATSANTVSKVVARDSNGDFAGNTITANNFNSLSDVNYKYNIQSISNPVDIITQLSGVEFKWKNNNEKSYGVIAQEIEKILPELVTKADNGSTVAYTPLIAILIEAIKQQNERIKALEIINNK